MASNSPPNGLAEKQWRMSSRTGPACQACRKRKTRCALSTAPEGGACEYCDSAEIACSFAPKLLGPPKTYVESLELRLQVTQNLLRNLSTSAGVDLVALANRSATEPAGASQEVQQAIEALRLREGSVKPSASENLQLPPLPPLNPNRTHLQGVYDDRFAGKTAPHSFVNEILHDYVDGVQITAAGEQQSLVDHLIAGSPDRPTTFNFPLPPAEILQLFVDLFFSHFNGQLPLLHRPSFERALFAGLADSDASFRTLLFTVLAIGARWLDDPQAQRDWTPKALFISSCSLFNIRVFSSACPTLYDLQASALVVVHLLGAESSPCAWSAAGIGLRKLVDVGAHLETSEKWTRSPLEDQLRKRAFHLLYVLDRELSASCPPPSVGRSRSKTRISTSATLSPSRTTPSTSGTAPRWNDLRPRRA
ncbi:fungal-specific transcription factor domain-domain-containing protein [Leucosporidium creatinivorum]|uniref:Fungal-specific transcription factor domain-domain-containing protein n=1 Tax=Leucosporidium creatinivorum TaxID=106004 RepID=A0A1Y2DB86_9BASI|nr:fungal-specific transcription factor domain-domain-containing protein [Leucosporidium creatinivorum]